jgi:hypothetical protein
MMICLPALRTGRALLHRNIIFLLLVLISVRGERTPGPSAAGRIRYIEKLIHLIGSGTRDLTACSRVP